MTEFRTLYDALNYRVSCPVCDSRLHVNDSRYITGDLSDYRECDVFVIDRPDFMISIDLTSNDVLKLEIFQPTNAMSAMLSSAPHRVGNIFYERVVVDCEDCSQYSYCFQLLIDSKEGKVTGIPFNSETITFIIDDDPFPGTVHEIRNVYTLQETQYRYFNGRNISKLNQMYPNDEKGIKIPLVPLDIYNPQKTLQRIKNLIVFS